MRTTRAAFLLLFVTVSFLWGTGSERVAAQAGRNAQDSLNRAADAILALKSARFSLKREGTPAVLG